MNACLDDNDGIILIIEGDNQVTVVDDSQKGDDNVVEVDCDQITTALPTTLPTEKTTVPTTLPTTLPSTVLATSECSATLTS